MRIKEKLINDLPFIEDAKLESELIRYLTLLNLKEKQQEKICEYFVRVYFDGVFQGNDLANSVEDLLELVNFKFTPKPDAKTPQDVIEKAKKNLLLFKKI
jgi:hypothetical protein